MNNETDYKNKVVNEKWQDIVNSVTKLKHKLNLYLINHKSIELTHISLMNATAIIINVTMSQGNKTIVSHISVQQRDTYNAREIVKQLIEHEKRLFQLDLI